MSVVINDFEIITEPPPDASPEDTESEPAPTPAPIQPRDVEAIMERVTQRRRRLRAH
jgi:hypothetical protein